MNLSRMIVAVFSICTLLISHGASAITNLNSSKSNIPQSRTTVEGSKSNTSVQRTVKSSKSNSSERTTVKSGKSNSSDRTTVKGSKSNSSERSTRFP